MGGKPSNLAPVEEPKPKVPVVLPAAKHECTYCVAAGPETTCARCHLTSHCTLICKCAIKVCTKCLSIPAAPCAVTLNPPDVALEGLVIGERVPWDLTRNRGYCFLDCKERNKTVHHSVWTEPLKGPLVVYRPPSGWYRLGVKVAPETLPPQPDWGLNWQLLYHGLHPTNIHKILENGFRPTECQHGFPGVYFTPSIIYASHPRYARVIYLDGNFFQFALEVRVDVRKLTFVRYRETLSVGNAGDIDPAYPKNENLEYVLKGESFLKPSHGVIVSGVMVRRLPFDPAALPTSWWWTKWHPLAKLHKHYYKFGSPILPGLGEQTA